MSKKNKTNLLKLALFLLFYFLYLYFIKGYALLESALRVLGGIGGFLIIFLIGWIMWRLFTGSWNPKKWIGSSKRSTEGAEKADILVIMKYFVGGLGGAITLVFLLAVIIRLILNFLKL